MMRVLVRGGVLVSPEGTVRADALIEDGVVSCVEDRIGPARADSVVDADGMLILPGGVDPHVHMGYPFAETVSCDDFASGSRAAVAGGTTTIVDFALPAPEGGLREAVAARLGEASRGSRADFALHCIVRRVSDAILQEVAGLVAGGVSSFKVFTTYDEQRLRLDPGDLVPLFGAVAKAGGLITVHAEEPSIVSRATQGLAARQLVGSANHPVARPPLAESAMVALVIELAGATGCPVYFHHISTARAVDLIAQAKASGQAVYGETCPHYLVLDGTLYEADEPADYAVTPPLRTKDDQERLWQGLRDGTVDTVGTDHCPFQRGQKRRSAADLRGVPNGLPGVETRLALIYSSGVVEGRLDVGRWVEVCCRRPAELFGLAPDKGVIRVGSDADLVLFDPQGFTRLEVSAQQSNCDWSPYEGMEVRGRVVMTIRRGEQVWHDGVFPSTGAGQFVPRRAEQRYRTGALFG